MGINLLGSTSQTSPPKKEPPPPLNDWFNQGNRQYKKGDFEDAIALFDKATETKPDDYQAWYNQGIMSCLAESRE